MSQETLSLCPTDGATAGRGVIRITTNQAFTYTGTGSTLVSQATATGADTLFIAARSVTMTTGALTALGADSTALDVTANGGAGLGGIAVTVDGDILSAAGRGIILDQNNSAATGNVVLTSTAGNTITSGADGAVTIIRRFHEQLLVAVEGPRKAAIRALLANECRLLRPIAGNRSLTATS